METYWCCKNNSIIDNYPNQDFNPVWCPALKKSVHAGKKGKVVVGAFIS